MLLISFVVVCVFTSILSLFFGIFVYLKGKTRRVNQIWGLMSLSVMLWSLGLGLMVNAPNENLALFYLRGVHYLGAIFIPAFFLHFILVLLGLERVKKKLIIVSYIFALGLQISNFSGLLAYVAHLPPFKYYTRPGIFYLTFAIFFAICIFYTLYLLFVEYKRSSGARRNQIKYQLLATVIGFGGGSTAFFPVFDIPIFPYGMYFMFLYILLMSYAIVKYHLLDINIVLTRAGIFVLVYALVLGTPFGLAGWGKAWLISIFGEDWLWLPMLILLGLGTAGPFIYQYLRRHAEDIILADQRRYQNTLRQLSAKMTLVKDLERLLKLIVYRTAKVVKIDFACIYLADNSQNKFIQKAPYTTVGFFPDSPTEIPYNSDLISYIKQKHKPVFAEELTKNIKKEFNLKSGLIVPSFVRNRLLGFLVLWAKSSGAIYTQDDANLFEILANQAALAIENADFINESQRTQAQLFAAERMTSLGTMAGGMSHQLNNRFHAIMLATSYSIDTLKFIDTSSCSQEVKDYFEQIKYVLKRIEENAEYGGKTVNNFLNFSQPDRIQRESRMLDLTEPLARAIEMERIKVTFSEESIEKEIQNDLPKIRGDFVLLQDVFFNLIDNAVDALTRKKTAIKNKKLLGPPTYKGKITIRMFEADSRIVIQIQDDGIGMTEETKKRLFVPFFTTKASSSKGTGLGLFVIQKVIDAHQGQIRVSSEYGQGTTFSITLPITQRKRADNEPQNFTN